MQGPAITVGIIYTVRGGGELEAVRAGDSSMELLSPSDGVVPLPSANTLGTSER